MAMIDTLEVCCVVCDSCAGEATAEYLSLALALQEAEELGWQVGRLHGGDDLCPTCAKERDDQYERNEVARRRAAAK